MIKDVNGKEAKKTFFKWSKFNAFCAKTHYFNDFQSICVKIIVGYSVKYKYDRKFRLKKVIRFDFFAAFYTTSK